MEKILIVVAALNGEKFIIEQINSILKQKECLVHIVVFDDCSSDRTIEKLRVFEKNKNIEIIINSKPSGSSAQNFLNSIQYINNNKKYKKYEFFSLSDQDDIWEENKLWEGIKNLKQNYNLYMSDLTIISERNDSKKDLIKNKSNLKKYDFLFEGGSAGCTYIFDRTVLNLIDNNYSIIRNSIWKHFSHDWFIYFIARINKLNIFRDNRSFIKYRLHDSNIYGNLYRTGYSQLKKVPLFFDNWFEHNTKGYMLLLSKESIEYKILNNFNSGYIKKLITLSYFNFELMRSKKKFLMFYLLNIVKF